MSTAVTSRLLNPAADTFEEYDELTRRLFRATIDWFEAKGKAASRPRCTPTSGTRTSSSSSRRACVRDAADAGAGRRAIRTSAGTRTQRDVQRDPRLLRSALLVRVAGHDPRTRPDLAERQRCRSDARRAAARRWRGVRVRPLRARPRCRHLLDRHDPDSGRRRLSRHRRQVLHRQRQRGGHGVGVRPPRRRRGPRRLRVLRRRQRPPGLQAASRTSCTGSCT